MQVKDERFTARARDASPAEKPALWKLMTEQWPDYDAYQRNTERQIPVVVLEPEPEQVAGYGRASSIRLKGVSVARRTSLKPALLDHLAESAPRRPAPRARGRPPGASDAGVQIIVEAP